jgi:hypothetical protein
MAFTARHDYRRGGAVREVGVVAVWVKRDCRHARGWKGVGRPLNRETRQKVRAKRGQRSRVIRTVVDDVPLAQIVRDRSGFAGLTVELRTRPRAVTT